MPQESKLPNDWYGKAGQDLRRVEILLAADDTAGAGFHLQQAAEKYLKGYLLGKGWPLKRTHDLEVLLNEAITHDNRFQKYLDVCITVREFYVEERYPFIDSPSPARAELEAALDAIQRMVTLILPLPEPKRAAPARQPFEPDMVLIPAGEFLMGSDPRADKDAFPEEQPQHRLYLPDYSIARTPVTNAQYAAFVEAHDQPPNRWKGWKPPEGKEEHSVVNVSWYDVLAYCAWLSKVTGKSYRLPSEPEWEKGARGTDGRIYPWGNARDVQRCNSNESGVLKTAAVGAYPAGASPYGLLDMAGNVWEWTLSLWGKGRDESDFKYPYRPGDGRENLEADASVLRVLRGGAFADYQRYVRCAYRFRDSPNLEDFNIGFRVMLAPGF
jgi:formylglycine-generating enzyme required for sulfatase activity